MARIQYIHWKEEEAASGINYLERMGHQTIYEPFRGPESLKKMRENPPDLFVINLSRLPSQGRDLALAFRHSKITRYIPILFVQGDPEKIKKIKTALPDAVYTSWDQLDKDLTYALDHPPPDPVVPESALAGYSGTPLPKKLGIKPNSHILLLDAPDNFETILGQIPSSVKLSRNTSGKYELVIWFATGRTHLVEQIKKVSEQMSDRGGLWIVWPKKTSNMNTDLNQNIVRQTGLQNDLVDYKIGAIDKTWSGLKFAHRKKTAKKK